MNGRSLPRGKVLAKHIQRSATRRAQLSDQQARRLLHGLAEHRLELCLSRNASWNVIKGVCRHGMAYIVMECMSSWNVCRHGMHVMESLMGRANRQTIDNPRYLLLGGRSTCTQVVEGDGRLLLVRRVVWHVDGRGGWRVQWPWAWTCAATRLVERRRKK